MVNSLLVGFDGSTPQSDDDVDQAMQRALLSLDANVLLNFYRFSPNARDALASVLRAAGERVWVSHQAATEFWRNRLSAIDSRNSATERLQDALDKQERAALTAADTWAKQMAVPDEVKSDVRAALQAGYEAARDRVESESGTSEQISYGTANDPVLDVLSGLLSACVGSALSDSDHAEAVAEGNRRAKEEEPPGYLDAGKLNEGNSRDGASGDYLVWIQSVKEATARGIPLAIVTGDEKEDWWWKHRNVFLGPRQELVAEFSQCSDQRLFLLRPVQLINHAHSLNVEVPEGAAKDVESATTESGDARWTREAVLELLRRLDAEGREQADVIRSAATQGGVIKRDEVYEIAGYNEDRMLRGFTRPTSRITRKLQEEGLVGADVEQALKPVYESGVQVLSFEIPLDMVEILNMEPGSQIVTGSDE